MDIGEQIQKLNEIDLSEIDLSRAGMWPTGGKFALLCFVFVIILLGGFYWYVKPLIDELNAEKEREISLKSTFEKRAHQASNLEAYRLQNDLLVERFDSLLRQLPSDTEVPGLLEDVTEVGVNGGLDIQSIDLKPEVVNEFFVELPMSIVLNGSYHNFGAFVSGVAALPRIVTLHDFSISGRDSNDLRLEISAKTYRYRE